MDAVGQLRPVAGRQIAVAVGRDLLVVDARVRGRGALRQHGQLRRCLSAAGGLHPVPAAGLDRRKRSPPCAFASRSATTSAASVDQLHPGARIEAGDVDLLDASAGVEGRRGAGCGRERAAQRERRRNAGEHAQASRCHSRSPQGADFYQLAPGRDADRPVSLRGIRYIERRDEAGRRNPHDSRRRWHCSRSASPARPGPAAAVDRYLHEVLPRGASGTLVAAVGGERATCRGFGLANRARKTRARCDTVYDVMSMTKQFTAAAILKLEMIGKLAVGDPISEHLAGVPADKGAITLHHLLTHTAGLPGAIGGDYEPLGREAMLARPSARSSARRRGRGTATPTWATACSPRSSRRSPATATRSSSPSTSSGRRG